jgi:hypothetical protein
MQNKRILLLYLYYEPKINLQLKITVFGGLQFNDDLISSDINLILLLLLLLLL